MKADPASLCKAHSEAQFKLVDNAVPVALPAPTATLMLLPVTVDPASCAKSAQQHDTYYLSRLAPDGSPPIFLRLLVLRT